LGWVSPAEIDELGLSAAVGLAMRRAVRRITTAYDEIIIDGNYNFLEEDLRSRAIIKAEPTVPAVCAATLIAKDARARGMAREARRFPAYGFEKHVGYGTRLHREMLALHGVCEIHRKSFKPVSRRLANSL